ncbi:thioredoxin family protein [Variovorax humicola]|uniref:Thioredoxin family protein n=1 Tax=Variovorax humicola TaxID=1769758 RepID=A0ABU8VXI8_9BURK
MSEPYTPETTDRAAIDRFDGPTVVEFGTNWCGFCLRAEPLIDEAFEGHAGVRRIRVEDGSGRPLGRTFRVKLWPTLVFMRDGKEVARVVRPTAADEISRALGQITTPA